MSEYFEELAAFRDEARRRRQQISRQRLEGFRERFPEARIVRQTPYSIRFIVDGHLYDFYPQKCRLFIVRTGRWLNIVRRDCMEHLSRIFDEQRPSGAR